MAAPAAIQHPAGQHQLEGRPSGQRRPCCSGPELEGGVVKVRWWSHHQDTTDRGSQWPYLPPRFPLPSHLYIEEVDIWHRAQDTKQKSQDRLRARQSLGPEDASSVAAANTVEVISNGGGELLVGEGHDDG